MTVPTTRPLAGAALPPLPVRLRAGLERAGRDVAAQVAQRAAWTAPPAWPAAGAGAPTGARGVAAVLVLVGPGQDGEGDVLLIERPRSMRSHPGQVAFPGGGVEEADGGDLVATALREAREEAGVDPHDVRVLGVLPAVPVPPRPTQVTPVVAWSEVASARVGDPTEVAAVLVVPLAALADPASRHSVRTAHGWTGPAFTVGEVVVWGFTGVVLDALLRAADLERPWDAGRVLQVPARFAGGGRA